MIEAIGYPVASIMAEPLANSFLSQEREMCAFHILCWLHGDHQLNFPIMRIKAGTNSALTKVASSKIANPNPTPNILTIVILARVNDAQTSIMTNAALVMMRPVRSRPMATLAVLSPV